MTEKSDKSLLWRGAVGGILGSFLKAAAAWIYYSFVPPPTIWGYIGGNPVVFFAIIGIPSAAATGAMVSTILALASEKRGRGFGLAARIVLGGGIVGILGAILMHAGLSADNLLSWLIVSVFYLDFGVTIGVVAAAFARPSRRKK